MHDDGRCECEIYLERGAAAIRSENWSKAIKEYESALKVHADNYKALGQMGICYAELGNYEKALECFDEAIKYEPEYKYPWVNKGWVLAEIKQLEAALKCFNRAIEINPGYTDAIANKEKVLMELGPDYLKDTEKNYQDRSTGPKDSVGAMISEATRQGWLPILGSIPELVSVYENVPDYFMNIIDGSEPRMRETIMYHICRYLFAKGVEGVILWGLAPDGQISVYFDIKHLIDGIVTEVPHHLHETVVDSMCVGESLFRAHQEFIIQAQKVGLEIDLRQETIDTLKWIPRLGISYALFHKYQALG